jgi:hypothetical protein
MKYAFIVLIAIYLVTYGCSTDESEKTTSSHEPTATAVLENPPQSEMTAAPADQHEPAPATEAEQHQTAAAEPVADAQEAESEQVVMPCGKTMAKADAAGNAPCPGMQKQVVSDPEAADSEQVVMPCGRTMAKADIPENAPCLGMVEQDVTIPGSDEELSVAMQRMVETTNGVIIATRQLVTATYLMLNASQEAAGEAVEEGEEIHQGETDEQAAEQSAVAEEAEAAPEQEVVETMQQFISAAREVIDATNRAIYSVLEEKQQ